MFYWDVSHSHDNIIILLSNDSLLSHAGLFQHPTEPHRSLSIPVLLTELKDVTNFHMLGVYLRVPESRLTDIETRYQHSQGLDRCKKEVLSAWLQISPGGSLKELIDALRKIDEIALAATLEDKYCHRSPTQNGNQFKIISIIKAIIDLNTCSIKGPMEETLRYSRNGQKKERTRVQLERWEQNNIWLTTLDSRVRTCIILYSLVCQ